jgi:hypothetical protein
VKIRTVIESILSCDNSRVLALPADIIVSRATRIRLKFFANDVDDAPVRYTRGEVQFRWAGKSFAAVWVPGRNEYVADIPSQWTEVEGEYALTVSIRNGWKSSQLVEECVVFERVITVQGDAGQIIVAACLASLLMVSMFAVAFFIHRRTKSVKAFLVSFLKVEVILAVEICLELHASRPPALPPSPGLNWSAAGSTLCPQCALPCDRSAPRLCTQVGHNQRRFLPGRGQAAGLQDLGLADAGALHSVLCACVARLGARNRRQVPASDQEGTQRRLSLRSRTASNA